MEIYADLAMYPALAMFAIVGSGALLLAGAVVGFRRARRRDRLATFAEASVSAPPPPLVEGHDVVLTGVVRHVEGEDVAVKVSITQAGDETESSGSWSHSWTEIDREITVAPFLLELADGQTVRVTPPNDVDVADDLDQKVWIDRNHRVLSAELVPGEQIHARGRLERSDRAVPASAYRDVSWGWALVPSDGQMLLSSEPLGVGLRQRALFHRGFAWIALLLLLATQLSLSMYYARLFGYTAQATVTGADTYTKTDSDGDVTHHYRLIVRGGAIEIDHDDYRRVGRGSTVSIRVGSTTNWNLGAAATIHWLHGGAILVAAVACWIGYTTRRRKSRPWFRRSLEEGGAGRLPDMG